jgi:predicted SprT family Zn-dependent metalloprotease
MLAPVQERKLLTPELRAKVERRARELLDLSSKIWPEHAAKFQDAPEIRYDVKNKFGGYAITGGEDDWTIRLNLILCYENEADFIEQTVGHEVAHLVCRVVFGRTKTVVEKGQPTVKKVRSHGKEWRSVMEKFGLKPATYHKYDTSSIEVKPRKRAKRGAILSISQVDDMLKRLETGFKRLPKEQQELFVLRCQDLMEGVEGDDE